MNFTVLTSLRSVTQIPSREPRPRSTHYDQAPIRDESFISY
ncbi:hypothetical protein HMPREF9603_02225 [Cutibacterium acnes HL001PA1]|nr:hypothetical protein HMPREF9603_02225 [Cutibacterium acnes HL001PA1]